jgi:hypothetical protein
LKALLALLPHLNEVKNEKDDVIQQKLLLFISKKMMVFSLVNFGLILVWVSPFMFCYIMVGAETFFNLFLSCYSLIIISLISIVFKLKFKAL